MSFSLLSILNRAPQIIGGKPEDALPAQGVENGSLSVFSTQLNQQLAAQNSQDIKPELLATKLVTTTKTEAPIDLNVIVAGDLVAIATDAQPTDPVLLTDFITEVAPDDVYLNISTDEVLAHTGKLATQLIADERTLDLQVEADGKIATDVIAVEPEANLLTIEKPVTGNAVTNEVVPENPAVVALTHLLPQAKDAAKKDAVIEPETKKSKIDENTVVVPLIAALSIEQAVTKVVLPQTIASSVAPVRTPTPANDLPAPSVDADGDSLPENQKLVAKIDAKSDEKLGSHNDHKELEAVVQRVLANRADVATTTKTESFAQALAATNGAAPVVAFDAPKDAAEATLSSPDAAPVSASGAVGSSVGLSVAGQERASNILTLKASNFAVHDRTTTTDQVKVGIKQAIRAGVDRVSITLEPEELGRVEVKIDIHKNGSNHIVFTADNRFALEAIQRDAKQLEQALHNSGLGTESNTMEFNLNQRRESNDGQPERPAYGRVDGVGDGAPSETTIPMTAYYNVTVSEGLDIKV